MRPGGTTMILVLALTAGCTKDDDPLTPWSLGLQTTGTALSGVWGTGPDDVWAVGGSDTVADVRHYDGATWEQAATPDTPLLAWIHGVDGTLYAVGYDGTMVEGDGTSWTELDPGTSADLWGVFARSPTEVWVVGGDVDQGDPVLLRYDGTDFTSYTLDPADDPLGIHALFKVWAKGDTVFAVGQLGMILKWDGSAWHRAPAGAEANEDFVSLWGTSEDHIVAVGGRANARIARWDGTAWTTTAPSGVGGLNGVFMTDPDTAVVCGTNAYVGVYDPVTDELVAERPAAVGELHAAWGDGAGKVFAVGGQFRAPWSGLLMIREENP